MMMILSTADTEALVLGMRRICSLDHEGLGLGHLLTYDGRGRSDIIIILAWYGHRDGCVDRS